MDFLYVFFCMNSLVDTENIVTLKAEEQLLLLTSTNEVSVMFYKWLINNFLNYLCYTVTKMEYNLFYTYMSSWGRYNETPQCTQSYRYYEE